EGTPGKPWGGRRSCTPEPRSDDRGRIGVVLQLVEMIERILRSARFGRFASRLVRTQQLELLFLFVLVRQEVAEGIVLASFEEVVDRVLAERATLLFVALAIETIEAVEVDDVVEGHGGEGLEAGRDALTGRHDGDVECRLLRLAGHRMDQLVGEAVD